MLPSCSDRPARPRARWTRIIGGVLLSAALLAGCSAVRFGYNQGPELGYWWLDGFVGFNDAQAPAAREALGEWFAWHRRTQLADYAALLEKARIEVRGEVTPQQACRWAAEVGERIDRAVDRALPPAAQIARTLTPQQIQGLARRYAKRNAEFRDEFLQPDPKRRLEASAERAVDRFERIYGRLDASQKALVAREVAASPFDPDRWMAERERRQRELLEALARLQAEQASPVAVTAALRGFVEAQQRSPDPAYREYQQRLLEFNCGFAARVHNAITPAQREAAAGRLKGWEDDLRALAGVEPTARRVGQADAAAAESGRMR